MTAYVDRLRGGMMGLLVGDAMGVPYEFTPKREIPRTIDFEGSDSRHSHGQKPGTYSDDGAQALCLLESLLDSRGSIPNGPQFLKKLLAWKRFGYLAIDGKVFDCGGQTSKAILDFESSMERVVPSLGCPAPKTLRDWNEFEGGNGSLMRILPLALWAHVRARYSVTGRTVHTVTQMAQWHSRSTHGSRLAGICCALYCNLAGTLLAREGRQPDAAWHDAIMTTMSELDDNSTSAWTSDAEILNHLLEQGFAKRESLQDFGTGYCVDSLLIGVQVAIEAEDYRSGMRMAIRYGGDTDTNAAIAGGLLGIRFGVDGIPKAWRAAMRGKEHFEPLVDALVAMVTT